MVYRYRQRPDPRYTVGVYQPLEEASPPRPCAAFVHGLEEGWEIWEPVALRLARALRSFCLDLPWSGRCRYDWAHETGVRRWIARGLGLVPRPVDVVVAHSFGVNALLEHFDARGLGSVKAAVLVSPFYRGRHEFSWPAFHHYMDNFERFLAAGLQVRRSGGRQAAEPDPIVARKVLDRIGPLGCLQFLNIFSRTPRLRLRALSIPVLIVGGEEDFYSLPEDCETLRRALPRAESRLLRRCGHFAMIEQPEALSSLIEQFLARSLGSPEREDEPAVLESTGGVA
jgi:pimeloyl-ACP methyl ester carboxylesterase